MRVTVVLLVALVVGATAAESAFANGSIVLERGKRSVQFGFFASTRGEATLDLTASARRADWGELGREAAVVSVSVDGVYATDLLVPSDEPTPRALALGTVARGKHTLQLRFASNRSSKNVRKVRLSRLDLDVVEPSRPEHLALRHAPVVYGRTIPVTNSEGLGTSYSGPFQNAVTDTPLLAWHEATAAAAGHRILEYSIVWSNEDGGTNSPQLMARWGRTTDIEWVYRVEVDANGDRVPGTAVYQGPDHVTTPFAGAYEQDHPLLQTCTNNNNMCADLNEPRMRFFLAADETRPVDRAREILMDRHPWTYPVMAAEMVREGRIESPSDAATPGLGDQRTYLYLEIDKDTLPPNPPGSTWLGASVGVRLAGDPAVYRSDHLIPDRSINRDVPAATTVELPEGTTAADVAEILAFRVPVGLADTGASITVTRINRAFFLDERYLPGPSFIGWEGSVTLTPDRPSATLWARAGT
jgi:hypothetical protein